MRIKAVAIKPVLVGLVVVATAAAALLARWIAVRSSGADGHGDAIVVKPVDEGFVGSLSCADCHREIWERYQRHPMAHSLQPVLEASPVEDYADQVTFRFPESRQYSVERLPDRVLHHEIMTDDKGEVVYDQAVEVQYTLGSGKRGRSYLSDRGGLLYLSPIAWYSTAKKWDAAPEYPPLTHPRFGRRATDKCLSCHAGRLSYDRSLPDRYGQPTFLEASIGCERCHGPGAGHVRIQASENKPASTGEIVNPARLGVAARADICNQCHLQDDVRILRNGRSNHDFRPGQRLEDVWAVFIGTSQAPTGDTARAVNQVHQMRASVCYQNSAGRLECISCHDPHGIPDEASRADFYNARCLNCHREKGCSLPAAERVAPAVAGSCIACHMPPLTASNIPHTSQTDHRIVRPLNAPLARPHRELQLFDGSETRLPPDEVERARGLVELMDPVNRPDADAVARLLASLSPIASRFPDDVDVLEALGILSMYQNRPDEAERHWRQALQSRPLHEGILSHLAAVQGQLNNTRAALATTRQLVRADAWQAESHFQLAQLLEESGDLSGAITAVEAALKINPTLVPLREWLAWAYRQSGRFSDALHQERLVKRMRGR